MTPNEKPLLLVQVDGVISLFGFDPARPRAGRYVMVDGIIHLLSATAGRCLQELTDRFDLAWCTGWEEKANEYLPLALELGAPLPSVSFGAAAATPPAHWKLAAIDVFAAPDRPVAWIDDAHDDACRSWAITRPAPTLLVTTDPAAGITNEHVATLRAWADSLLPASGEAEPGDGGGAAAPQPAAVQIAERRLRDA